MTAFSLSLWIFLGIFGLPLLLVSLCQMQRRRFSKDLDGMQHMTRRDFALVPFREFPLPVRLLLSRYRKAAQAMGFQELVSFSRRSIASPNFSIIYVSPDRRTVAEVEYAAVDFLTVLLTAFVQPSKFLQCLIGPHGMCLTSVLPNLRRVMTTPHAFLAENEKPGEREFHVVPAHTAPAAMYEQHQERITELCARENVAARLFSDEEQFFAFEVEVLAKAAAHARQSLEEEAGSTCWR